MNIRRKLYSRGISYEVTVPMPILFNRDLTKKHDILFEFDPKTKRWYIDFQERGK